MNEILFTSTFSTTTIDLLLLQFNLVQRLKREMVIRMIEIINSAQHEDFYVKYLSQIIQPMKGKKNGTAKQFLFADVLLCVTRHRREFIRMGSRLGP